MINNKADPLDNREYELIYHAGALNFDDVSAVLTQRELRMIIKHVEKRNKHLTTILKDLIYRVDSKERRGTNWNARVPKTHIIRSY